MRAVRPSATRQSPAIGARLRGSRLSQGLTIANIAEATGLNKSFVSKVERDETSPSVATLVALCEALSLSVGDLFRAPEYQVIAIEEAPTINMGGEGVIDRLITPRSEPRLQMLHSTMKPGATGGDELYTINCDVEVVHVLRGQIVVRLGAEEHLLGTGETMSLPGREPHSWHNPGTVDTEVIWVLAPAAWSGSAIRG